MKTVIIAFILFACYFLFLSLEYWNQAEIVGETVIRPLKQEAVVCFVAGLLCMAVSGWTIIKYFKQNKSE